MMKSDDLIETADRLINLGNDVLKAEFVGAHSSNRSRLQSNESSIDR
ncbi:MAG: hypothetical protein A4E58_01908 [Syntrophorhabdus sp. PtaB.Bin006]|nr:MAG: hypothetical protein A4E58_01908 [Syntrophorhabdus sp. PtaB.Bin006]